MASAGPRRGASPWCAPMHERVPVGNTRNLSNGGDDNCERTTTMTTPTPESSRPDGPARESVGSPWLMLVMATLGFAVNFWAWALLSPLAPGLKESLRLTSFDQSLLVAVPVLVGSLGRIPVGALTDRFGGRVMFPAVSLITIAPVLYLGLAGHSSLPALLVG